MCVALVVAAASPTPRARGTARSFRRRSWRCISSVLRCAACSAQRASRARRCPSGSKKDTQMRAQNPHYLLPTLLPAQSDDVLELDELWSFVQSKKQAVWLWVALCRRTRQVVAWHWGDRSAETCRRLWEKIPPSYQRAFCFSDLWEAYQKVLPKEQHQPCGKEEGETNHVERFNLTLRQRLGRLTRKTLSFSKSVLMHLIVFRLFLVRYNQQKAQHYIKSTMAG